MFFYRIVANIICFYQNIRYDNQKKKVETIVQNFKGFVPETIDFLWELRMNNNKQWMMENRNRYLTLLKEPFEVLTAVLLERFHTMYPQISVDTAISRINRDIRFSKDKSPYRARRWMVLKEPMLSGTQWKERPVFYFELTPESYISGLGIYETKPQYMRAFRKKIDAAPEIFSRMVTDLAQKKECKLLGEKYKRTQAKTSYTPEVMEWYERKSLDLVVESPIDKLLFSEDLVSDILQQWEKMLPMYRYLCGIVIEK